MSSLWILMRAQLMPEIFQMILDVAALLMCHHPARALGFKEQAAV